MPPAKFRGLSDTLGTLFQNDSFKFEMVGLTPENKHYNLQIKRVDGEDHVLAFIIAPRTAYATPSEFRRALKQSGREGGHKTELANGTLPFPTRAMIDVIIQPHGFIPPCSV
ncbi:hypothetical protein DACRYDRAFT_22420 [Dacryopinax primogenitus]|uniref:Uncharacterized protein n=1 Tax=Dacryopinax primogenitus (strain DJM 731) TaxID=1858805 RepID=M5GCX4_DACPD|nr:uncharacterized protein DACRYDRAFT_22420 [Dacryopinax primogenitus]EJU02028.1 hypothetical protein DACRYDRAFT_22420 [Dacryopinax primogenitus]